MLLYVMLNRRAMTMAHPNPQVIGLLSIMGVTFKPGYNPSIRPCRLTLDNLDYMRGPLLFYLLIFAVHSIGRSLLSFYGFRR